MPRVLKLKTKRVRMLRSLVTPDGSAYTESGVYDLAVKQADSWTAYGVCEDAESDELHEPRDMESAETDGDGEPRKVIHQGEY